MALILIADDDDILVTVIRDALAARGHNVEAVNDGSGVLAIVESERPDLVILDCNMPEVSGFAALRLIRGSTMCYATPVLMLTGLRGEADEEIAMLGGANDYLRKPLDVDQLLPRVEALIDESSALRRPRALRLTSHSLLYR
jgi:DNA-binding response OmpR family regulator